MSTKILQLSNPNLVTQIFWNIKQSRSDVTVVSDTLVGVSQKISSHFQICNHIYII